MIYSGSDTLIITRLSVCTSPKSKATDYCLEVPKPTGSPFAWGKSRVLQSRHLCWQRASVFLLSSYRVEIMAPSSPPFVNEYPPDLSFRVSRPSTRTAVEVESLVTSVYA